MQRRDSAICLSKTDYSETSQVVHFLSRRSGVVRLLAKGAKRSKSSTGGAIDLMSEGDLVFIEPRGESLGTLVEFSETESRTALRGDATRLNTGLYMIELAAAVLADADPAPEVFDLLHRSLARLAQPDAPPPAVLAWLQWRTLQFVGLLGDLTECVGCGRAIRPHSGEVYFSSSEGGLVCKACLTHLTEKYRLEPAALAGLAALAAAAAGRRPALPDHQAHAVNRMLAYHVTYALGRPLKMARYAVRPAGA